MVTRSSSPLDSSNLLISSPPCAEEDPPIHPALEVEDERDERMLNCAGSMLSVDSMPSVEGPDEQTRWEAWRVREQERQRQYSQEHRAIHIIYQRGCRKAKRLGGSDGLLAFRERWKQRTKEQKALAVRLQPQKQSRYLQARKYQIDYHRAKRRGVKALQEFKASYKLK